MGRAVNSETDTPVASRRSGWSTNGQALAELGIDRAWLESYEDDWQPTQTATISWFETPDGDPVVGIVYRCDYRAEEEWGIGKLREAITGPDPRHFHQVEEGDEYIGFFTDVNAIVLSTEPLQKKEYRWGEPLLPRWWAEDDVDERGHYARYATHWQQGLAHAQGTKLPINSWTTVAELRAIGRELGLKGMPQRKAELYQVVFDALAAQMKPAHPETWPGWFADGKHLILRADGDGVAARSIRRLIAAAKEGHLGIGNGSGNPFASGVLFFDANDETQALRDQVTAQFAWHDEQMEKAAPVMEELAAQGYIWDFFGRPSTIDTGDGERKLRFWINNLRIAGYYDMRRLPEGAVIDQDEKELFRQAGHVYGWYTIEDLRAKRYLKDAEERVAEKLARAS